MSILDDIRSGRHAYDWQAEDAGGRPELTAWRERIARHPLEDVRRHLLAMVEDLDEPGA
ncbi:hypothetical protein [Actinoplanes sp. RD1]|uniref:hypothetical protein n=1 Tax=Actinoplanes sp. RD1 TaxID=3064538 RepID=UPI002741C9BF|nr:hypothetical protein [Actinoplanes sp. RD1]